VETPLAEYGRKFADLKATSFCVGAVLQRITASDSRRADIAPRSAPLIADILFFVKSRSLQHNARSSFLRKLKKLSAGKVGRAPLFAIPNHPIGNASSRQISHRKPNSEIFTDPTGVGMSAESWPFGNNTRMFGYDVIVGC
jgi:hypothetical protein